MYKVYCGTYGKYNAGSLDGKWFDLEDYDDKDEFIEACQEFHDRNNPVDEDGCVIPAEHEFMFQDFEGIPSCFISECSIDAEFWEFMEFNDHHDGDAKTAYVDWAGSWSESDFEDTFIGKYASMEGYAREFVSQCCEIPDWIEPYFDYAAYARDLEQDVWEESGFFFRR